MSVSISSVNGEIQISFPADARLGPSKSGKTIMVATTSGAVPFVYQGQTIYISLNAYVFPPRGGISST